jgi:hypothetical protein
MRSNNKLPWLLTAAVLCVWARYADASVASDLQALTGGKRVKVVYSRDTSSRQNYVLGNGPFRLMGYDSATGAERDLLGSVGNYCRAYITGDGNTVVYNSGNHIYRVGWDGSGNTLVASNMQLGCLWYDASSGRQYVFAANGGSVTDINVSAPIQRFELANPASRTTVYSGTSAPMWMAVSGDGKRLGGHFPWDGGGGLVNTDNGSVQVREAGCWGATPPDSSYRFVTFGNLPTALGHRRWEVYGGSGAKTGALALNTGPGINGWEIYHPRFAVNNASYVTVTGPYSNGPMGGNNIGSGGSQVEVYFGRVDSGLTQVNGWVKVTSNGQADYFPSAWVDPGGSSGPVAPSITQHPADVTVSVGQSASFSVSASGTGPLSYQWRRNGSNISGATSATYTISSVTAGDDGARFRCVVTNSAGSATSNEATLSVSVPVLTSIDIDPSSASVLPGGSVGLSATARDQNGSPMAAAISWSVDGGGAVAPQTGA